MNPKYKKNLTKFSDLPPPLPQSLEIGCWKNFQRWLTAPGPHGTSEIEKLRRFSIRKSVTIAPLGGFYVKILQNGEPSIFS